MSWAYLFLMSSAPHLHASAILTDGQNRWVTPVTPTCPPDDLGFAMEARLAIDVGGGGVWRADMQSTNASGDCLTEFANLEYCTGNTYAFEVLGALPPGAKVWSAILFKFVAGKPVFEKEFSLQEVQNALALSLTSSEQIGNGTWMLILKADRSGDVSYAGIQFVSDSICQGVVTGNGVGALEKRPGNLSSGCGLRAESFRLQSRGDFAWLGLIALFLGFLALFRLKIKND